MIITKFTEGWVVQTYDTETKKFVSQEFVTGDSIIEAEDEYGRNVDPNLMPYLPFDMAPVPTEEIQSK